ncbi:MAG: polyhydroxyalkanoic acid system family protein [Chitinophagaceae bacterium]
MTLSVKHELTQEEALKRVKGLISQLTEENAGRITSAKEDWQENKGVFEFSAMGYTLTGETVVNNNSVDIDAKLPFSLTLFQGAIKDTINKKLTELLKA